MTAVQDDLSRIDISSGRPIPLTRQIKVELRKMFDTRAGLWLMASIAIISLLATVGVIVFADDSVITYGIFATAIGFPMGILLPIVAILSVTSEWSQRTGLVSFTLEPRRSRLLWAKGIACVAVAIASILLAFALGALGNVVGAALAGVDTTWDVSLGMFFRITLGQILGLFMGFVFGVLLRNSAGAIVAYFAWSLVLPTITGMLAYFQEWFADVQPWVDFAFSQSFLFAEDAPTGEEWAQMGTSGVLWLVLPLAFGVWRLLRAEVK